VDSTWKRSSCNKVYGKERHGPDHLDVVIENRDNKFQLDYSFQKKVLGVVRTIPFSFIIKNSKLSVKTNNFNLRLVNITSLNIMAED